MSNMQIVSVCGREEKKMEKWEKKTALPPIRQFFVRAETTRPPPAPHRRTFFFGVGVTYYNRRSSGALGSCDNYREQ